MSTALVADSSLPSVVRAAARAQPAFGRAQLAAGLP
jgi:hypothetical protein